MQIRQRPRDFLAHPPPSRDGDVGYLCRVAQGAQRRRHASMDGDGLAVIAAFGLAALAGATLWFLPPFTSGDQLDLESLVPLVADSVNSVIRPGSVGSAHHGVAGLILIAVVAVTGLPLLAPQAARRPALIICAAAVTFFALATLVRNGLFFLPSAALLSGVAVRSTAKSTSRANVGVWV